MLNRRFTLVPQDLLVVNPNTGTTPLFRHPRDAEITFGIYRRVPVLWRDDPEENPWDISFMAMFHMANDSRLFRTQKDLRDEEWKLEGNVFVKDDKRMLPLYEAKMIHHFDHRYGTYKGQTQAQANVGTLPRPSPDEKADPLYVVMPRYWVPEFSVKNEQRSKPDKPVYDAGVSARLDSRGWEKGWLLGWRDICRSSHERTMINALIPRTAVPDGTLLMLPSGGSSIALTANLSSFVFDFVTRQKSAGTHLKYFTVKQLPVLPPRRYDEAAPWEPDRSLADWIEPRTLELSYTSWDMEQFARDLGDEDPPFVWDEERRFAIRAELDAAFFHLYGINRDDVDYIMETFPVVRRRDEERFGDYRTKLLILKIYDAMAEATETGQPYPTVVSPAPGHGKRHPGRQPGLIRRSR